MHCFYTFLFLLILSFVLMFIVQVKSLLDNVDGSRTALSVATEVQNELSGPLLAARVMEP